MSPYTFYKSLLGNLFHAFCPIKVGPGFHYSKTTGSKDVPVLSHALELYVLFIPPSRGNPYKVLDLVAATADSLCHGDLIEKRIRSSQQWNLLPIQVGHCLQRMRLFVSSAKTLSHWPCTIVFRFFPAKLRWEVMVSICFAFPLQWYYSHFI